MLKRIFVLTIVLAWSLSLMAQEKDDTPVIDIHQTNIDTSAYLKKPALRKTIFNLTAGTSFLYSKSFGSGLSTYVAPELKYKITPKLHLNVGVMVVNSNIYSNRSTLYGESVVLVKDKPTTSVFAYISGDYLLTDKLRISGTMVKDLSTPQGMGNSYNNSLRAVSVHMDYKLTKNISVGAGMHMSQGNNFGSPALNGFSPGNYYNPMFGY